MVFIRLSALFILMCLSVCALAKSTDERLINRKIRFEKLSLQHKLSHRFAESMSFEQNGKLWIGTQDGLNLFDGFNVTVFSESSPTHKISDNYILKVYHSPSGNLYVGHRGGIDVFDQQLQRFYPLEINGVSVDSIKDVNDIQEHPNGALWFSTRNDGVFRYESKTGTVQDFQFDETVLDLFIDRYQNVFLSTAGAGVFQYSEQLNIFRPLHQGVFEGNYVSKIVELGENRYLLGGRDQFAVFTQDRDGEASFNLEQELLCPGRATGGITQENYLWLSTTSTVCLFEKEQNNQFFKVYETKDLGVVTGLVMDHFGAMWLSSGSGVFTNSSKNSLFHHYTVSEKTDNRNFATSFENISGNELVVGSWDTGVVTEKGRKFELPQGSHVLSLLTDRNNHLWVGTFSKGIFKFDAEGNLLGSYAMKIDETTATNAVNELVQLGNGKILAGTFGGGLFRLEPSQSVFLSAQPPSLNSKYITSIASLTEELVAVSTYDSGIYLLSALEGLWRNVKVKALKLPSSRIMGLTKGNDELYIATQDKGVLSVSISEITSDSFDLKSFDRDNAKLKSNSIYGILTDETGSAWISHSKGISILSLESARAENFSIRDGLQDSDFTAGSYFKGVDGKLYFGGSFGYNQISPASYIADTVDKLNITASISSQDLQLQLTDSELKQNVFNLDYQEGVEIEMFANNLLLPEGYNFHYRWKESLNGWVSLGNTNRLVIPALVPGERMLMLSLVNEEGAVVSNVLEVTFAVRPPLWRSFPAYLFYLLILLLVYLGFDRRKRQKAEKQYRYKLKLERTVEERTKKLNDTIIELKSLQRQTELESNTDPLTGLYNRRFFQNYLNKRTGEIERFSKQGIKKYLGIIVVDIDHFKNINDQLGHDVGDEVIRNVATGISKAIRAMDIAVRWGGEEFLIVAAVDDTNTIEVLGERLNDSIKTSLVDHAVTEKLSVTCSMGSFYWPLKSVSLESWSFEQSFQIADKALLCAKERGRNNHTKVYDEINLTQEDTNLEPHELYENEKLKKEQIFFKVT